MMMMMMMMFMMLIIIIGYVYGVLLHFNTRSSSDTFLNFSNIACIIARSKLRQ